MNMPDLDETAVKTTISRMAISSSMISTLTTSSRSRRQRASDASSNGQ
jgi:hypothetical protein